jgi:hypothetical protein
MNSFSGVRRALEYEIPRQIEVVKKGGKLIQDPRAAGMTWPASPRTMRTQGVRARLPLFSRTRFDAASRRRTNGWPK